MSRTSQIDHGPLEFSTVLRKHWGAAAVIALWVAIVAGFVAETAPGHQRWVSDPLTITLVAGQQQI
jgi:hypothetical protein